MVSKEDVEEIRRAIFSFGGEPNPFTQDPHQPVENPSIPRNLHVLKELIQNAEDNEYPEGFGPSLEFVITSTDITNIGAPATLLVFNNGEGFSNTDIESICGVGLSTKKGSGFKSVFLVTDQPYIFSNGYLIRFTKEHCHQCNISHIVPEWVEEDAMLSAIVNVYGSDTPLPTTTLVLPLNPKKVRPVKDQLSSVHPEVLLFLSKLTCFSVREVNEDPNELNIVSPISISSENSLSESKSMDAISYTVHLIVGDRERAYYMWEQRFQVKPENRVDIRPGVEEWVLTLAFPYEQILNRCASLPGIYSFLQTETVTNFPFIIQADFLLASSRENILWENKWNQGILDCVPVAFVNAFTSLVEPVEDAPVSNLLNMFRFLPVNESSHPKLNNVRDAIRAKLMNELIIACESDTVTKLFCKPTEAGRLKPSFWTILNRARSEGVKLPDISSHGAYLLPSSFDTEEYKDILDFLGIRHVDCKWYAKCINSYNLVVGVSEKVYIQLLVFIAKHWWSWSGKTLMKNIPLIKYVGWDGNIGLRTLNSCKGKLLAGKSSSDCISWMIDWNREFRCPDVPGIKELGGLNGNREFQFSIGRAFLPEATQKAIQSHLEKPMLVEWLEMAVEVKFVSISKYAEFLSSSVNYDPKLVVTYACFLYTSFRYDYMSTSKVEELCSKMPILDKHGKVNTRRSSALVPSDAHTNKNPKNIYTCCDWHHKPNTAPCRSKEETASGMILAPAKESKWVKLFGTNPWSYENYVELGGEYTRAFSYCRGDRRILIPEGELLSFLQTHAGASDVPHLSPPDAPIPTLSGALTKENAFLLLGWIHILKSSYVDLPDMFLSSIKNNRWLKVSLSAIHGYYKPSKSFMLESDSSIGRFLQDGSLPFFMPLIDLEFYGAMIREYKEALQTIGVGTEDTKACEYIGKLLMSLAASSELTRDQSLWILKFIEFLGKNHIYSGKFIAIVKKGKWVRTSHGFRTPHNSFLFSQKWGAASVQINDLPFIDQAYYGEEILSFKKQLDLLGVTVNFNERHQVFKDLKASLSILSPEYMFLSLYLIKRSRSRSRSSQPMVEDLYYKECLKTNLGYSYPSQCFLLKPESEWGCLLQVFESFPVIDEQYYGSSIFYFTNVLQKIGVKMDFEDAIKEFTRIFKQQASLSSITKEEVFSFLQCYRKLKNLELEFPDEFKKCIRQKKWIRTRLDDYRAPNECILFGKDWESVSSKSKLPFIDDTNDFYGNEIHNYHEELKELGVVTDFKVGAKFMSDSIKKLNKRQKLEEKA